MSPTPEQRARQDIDAALEAAGWIIQDRAAMNISAGPGVAVREFRMASGHGFADYLLFVNRKAVGVVEAKPAGYALTNVELQVDKYAGGLPAGLNPPVHPLPFLYLSTGVETRFINGLDPDPKTRAISANLPHIHRPATLAEWIDAETLDTWVKRLHAEGSGLFTAADDTLPSSFRGRVLRKRQQPDSTDWAIYSPDVPIFRMDDGTELPHPWLLSFITCAAPYAPVIGQPQSGDLLQKRIHRVLAIARAYGHATLVLGAWGCGAFENDPYRTATDFRQALENEYSGAFSDIVFAITDWSSDRKFLRPFRDVFTAKDNA